MNRTPTLPRAAALAAALLLTCLAAPACRSPEERAMDRMERDMARSQRLMDRQMKAQVRMMKQMEKSMEETTREMERVD
jgi:CobQ-like glutamine amidotransferase family enzyme